MQTLSLALAFLAVILSLLDVSQTVRGAKMGLVEASAAMRWLQKISPKGWVDIYPFSILAICAGLFFLGYPIAQIGLGIVALYHLYVCVHNYLLERKGS